MLRRNLRVCLTSFLSFMLWMQVFGCGERSNNEGSQVSTTDVAHTISKRQSIGNCWLYATASWLESLQLSYAQKSFDVSESYWTWWHFYNQLVQPYALEKIDTSGSFDVSRSLILNHGFVEEGVFIPAENSAEMSLQQSSAVAFINRELSDGELKSPADRTPEKVRQVLDEAFGTDMAAAELVAQSAEQTQVGTSSQGLPVSLHDSLDTASSEAWREVNFPRIWGETRRVDRATEKARRALWARVFHALNDHKPVVIDVMIDFNGLDASDGTFKGALLLTNGKGHQGGHLTVLDDYTVTDVPGLGRIGRGEVSAELKTKALQGRIETLVAKNSWGVNRPERGIKDGITIFERDYLEKQFPWKQDDSDPNSPVYWYTSLGGFLLPPGY